MNSFLSQRHQQQCLWNKLSHSLIYTLSNDWFTLTPAPSTACKLGKSPVSAACFSLLACTNKNVNTLLIHIAWLEPLVISIVAPCRSSVWQYLSVWLCRGNGVCLLWVAVVLGWCWSPHRRRISCSNVLCEVRVSKNCDSFDKQSSIFVICVCELAKRFHDCQNSSMIVMSK